MPPIVPCSSVNSRTMSVVRSALASRAARRRMRRRVIGDAEGLAQRSSAPDARCARPSPGSCPSFLWNSSVPSRSMRDSSGILPVGLPEEPRVAQPRRDDALGVAGDGPLVVGLGVDDGEKRVLQRAVLALRPGSSADDESASSSAPRPEARGTRGRTCRRSPTDTRPDRAPRAAARFAVHRPRLTRPCRRCALASSSRAILSCRSLTLEDDEVLEQPRAIFVERPHLDGAAGAAARRQEAVAVGDGARSTRPAPGRSARPACARW